MLCLRFNFFWEKRGLNFGLVLHLVFGVNFQLQVFKRREIHFKVIIVRVIIDFATKKRNSSFWREISPNHLHYRFVTLVNDLKNMFFFEKDLERKPMGDVDFQKLFLKLVKLFFVGVNFTVI
jgi:hypothetical protein